MYKKIKLNDSIIQNAINKELNRQENHIELIASENFVSNDVLKATGSILTNKYAEGYPGKRYYDGTKYVDIVENFAIDRLKKLFNVNFANVQPHSGSSANAAAIAALIEPGEKILGMSLDAGGHLTHGYKINFSGKFYKTSFYGVDDNGKLNYNEILAIAKKEKPQLIICGASAYSRVIDFKEFKKIADEVGAKLLADIAHIAGLVATNLHPTPVGFADIITSTTHKTLRGARGGVIMTNSNEISKKIDRWVFPGYQGGPLLHSIAGKAVSFNEALQPEFKTYIKQVIENSKVFAEEFKKYGVPVISGGTDNHLFMIDVKTKFNITGKDASSILQEIGITVNKNSIPNDTESPLKTSGLRLGTPAMTTRGFKEKEFIKVAKIIIEALNSKRNKTVIEKLKEEVKIIMNEYNFKNTNSI
ncbi:MAG: serine hydroxymethyltransferase [Mycoplasma sp.]|nr:serine hydroxymethyltransferase [Mycoplasma sp.]